MDQQRWTTLMHAAKRDSHLPIDEYLVEQGADEKAMDIASDAISLM